jgi:anti-sigma B factor antagonist
MATANFRHLSVKEVGQVAVVAFVNSQLMYGTSDIEEIDDELTSLVSAHGYSRLLLDFSDVQYVSSTMLAKLISLERRIETAKGRLALCGLGPVLMDTFRIGHLDRVFAIYNDVNSAIASF